jgi:hypothetical protein
MHARTTTAVAMAGTALAIPAAAIAAAPDTDPPSPVTTALHAPVAGHLTVAGQMRGARLQRQRVRLSATATRLARRLAAEGGDDFRRARFRARLRGDEPHTLRTRVKHLRRDLDHAERAPATAEASGGAVPTPAYLQTIAACESGGNPSANTGNGFYGKYQFTQSTWASVGGTGNPAAASEAEQDKRAAMLYASRGSSPWPVCGR